MEPLIDHQKFEGVGFLDRADLASEYENALLQNVTLRELIYLKLNLSTACSITAISVMRF